jgi:hypothetical protein
MNPASSPTLSIIIVSYNTRDLLAGCLNSLRRVSDEADFEVIVVDNASSDGTTEMLRERYPEVAVLASEKNLGFAAANSRGLAQARGKFLFFLNPDTLVPRGTLVQLLKITEAGTPTRPKAETEPPRRVPSPARNPMLQDKGVGVIGASLIYPDGTPQLSVLEFPNLWREFWNFLPEIKSVLVLLKGVLNSLVPIPARQSWEPRRVGCVSGAAMMVRADAMREIGGFDEGFFLYHEERDLCYRLAAAGWEIWTAPAATVIHFDAQSSGYQPHRFPRSPILEYRILGMDRLYRKHRPAWQHKLWRLRSRNMLRIRALWRKLRGDAVGADELMNVVSELKRPQT